MPNNFHTLYRLSNQGCSCLIVNTGFPADEAVVIGSDSYNTAHWERVGGDGTGDGDGGIDWLAGTIDQSGGSLEISGAAKLKWIGSCSGRHSAGLWFRIGADVADDTISYLFYACNSTLDVATGYTVRWYTTRITNTLLMCNVDVRWQGTSIITRMVPIGDYGDDFFIAFRHVPDADDGGVYITIGEGSTVQGYAAFLHAAGPQVGGDNFYWGIGIPSGSAEYTSLRCEHNGNVDDDRVFCRECDEIGIETGCDTSVACGGGTLKTQPGEVTVDYDFGGEVCGTYITPYQDDGWYKECDGGGAEADYRFWSFLDLTATLDFSGIGHCGAMTWDADTKTTAWRFFRVDDCDGADVTLTITMNKSKYAAASAGIGIHPFCGPQVFAGAPVGPFEDIGTVSLSETWAASTTTAATILTTCSGSSTEYFQSDVCVMDDTDTVTLDIPKVPKGLYRVEVTGTQGTEVTAETSACSGVSATLRLPIQYDFEISGAALEYDPICH